MTKRIAAVAGMLAAALTLAGCGLLDPRVPEEARVVLTGPAGSTVRVITSTKFVAGQTQLGTTQVTVIDADTVEAALPYESRHRIRADQRFLANVEAIEGETTAFRMQVYIDTGREYDEAGTLSAAALFRFVYAFNHRMPERIEVVF